MAKRGRKPKEEVDETMTAGGPPAAPEVPVLAAL